MPEESDQEKRWFDALKLEADKALLDLHFIEQELSKEKPKKAELEHKVAELREHIEGLLAQSKENIKEMFENMQKILTAAKEEIMKLTAPPKNWGIFLGTNDKGEPIVFTGGRKLTVNLSPSVDLKNLSKGQDLELNEAFNIVSTAGFDPQGEVARLKDILDENRLVVTLRADEERVVEIADCLKGEKFHIGDILRFDPKSGIVLERLPKAELGELMLEKVPDVTYAQVGGLRNQIEQLREVIEFPSLYAEIYTEHQIPINKGILLYGPPGCGKTLIAKAVANAVAQGLSAESGAKVPVYFMNIKGPQLLNKYVGETERQIREIFHRAREKAAEGAVVVIFFDEFESLFRTRGSGISSDVESTIVPQLLSEIDGVEGINNVLVIGATNRQDMIDPAVLRPGRFDIKIKIDRPDKDGVREIAKIHFSPRLPFGEDSSGQSYIGQKSHHVIDRFNKNREYTVDLSTPEQVVDYMINVATGFLFYVGEPLVWKDRSGQERIHDTRYLKARWADGEEKILYIKDLIVSGAMIASVTTRVKKAAAKRLITTGKKGITMSDWYEAIKAEISENQDLPNTNNPDDWAKILGQQSESGQRLVSVTIIHTKKTIKPNKVEIVTTTGHYL